MTGKQPEHEDRTVAGALAGHPRKARPRSRPGTGRNMIAQPRAPLRILPTRLERSVIHPILETDTMTTIVTPSPTLDLSDSIRLLHRRLDFALLWHFTPEAREVGTIARYLARKAPSQALKALATRARTTVRLLEASRYV